MARRQGRFSVTSLCPPETRSKVRRIPRSGDNGEKPDPQLAIYFFPQSAIASRTNIRTSTLMCRMPAQGWLMDLIDRVKSVKMRQSEKSGLTPGRRAQITIIGEFPEFHDAGRVLPFERNSGFGLKQHYRYTGAGLLSNFRSIKQGGTNGTRVYGRHRRCGRRRTG
jgi:hypothetical protein